MMFRIKKKEKAMWIFACYDHDRVQAMALAFNTAGLMSEEHAINTVRSRFSIAENETVNFVKPLVWNAPNIKATATSFDVDMQKVNQAIIEYLKNNNYRKPDVKKALENSFAIPNPKLGILLFCVDLR